MGIRLCSHIFVEDTVYKYQYAILDKYLVSLFFLNRQFTYIYVTEIAFATSKVHVLFTSCLLIFAFYTVGPVSWGSRIHLLLLCKQTNKQKTLWKENTDIEL